MVLVDMLYLFCERTQVMQLYGEVSGLVSCASDTETWDGIRAEPQSGFCVLVWLVVSVKVWRRSAFASLRCV